MSYDYIVVGGGSSGCAVASRLAEDRDIKVLLLEAGGPDSDRFIHLPVGFYKHSGGPLTWGFETEEEPAAKNRRMSLPQARVLGGGSSINAMVYVRGAPQDFDAWAHEHQCTGWSFRDIEPFFLRTEGNDTFSGKHHGANRPLRVSDAVTLLPLTKAFLRACQDFGIAYNPDFNSGRLEGCGPYQRTVSNGRRCSAVTAFLKEVDRRENLTVKTGCLVRKIIIEKHTAVGVQLEVDGNIQEIRAEREVILAAGSINSPKILMLSGVGESSHLSEFGIPIVHDLKGVGKNLQEHTLLGTTWGLGGPYSYDRYKKPLKRILPALQYYMFKSGPVTKNIAEAGGFWSSDDSEAVPDIQFFILLGSFDSKDSPPIEGGNGVTMSTYPCRPRSRGTFGCDPASLAISRASTSTSTAIHMTWSDRFPV